MINVKKIQNLINFKLILKLTLINYIILNTIKIKYQLIIKFLIYFILKTRLNIVFVIFQISRFVVNLTKTH